MDSSILDSITGGICETEASVEFESLLIEGMLMILRLNYWLQVAVAGHVVLLLSLN